MILSLMVYVPHCRLVRLQSYLSGDETGIFQKNKVYTMAADAMAPRVARTSVTTVLVMQNQLYLVFREKEFHITVTS